MGPDSSASLDSTDAVFERVYATELVYEPDCWRRCGDAHCCHFGRHKARFRMLARGRPFQELPLLPGELDYLRERGWDRQFGDHEVRTVSYRVGDTTFRAEAVISHRPMCACDHGTRTTVCRLYPLLPVLDPAGRLIGTEALGTYEELERLDGIAPLCRIDAVGLAQLNVFLGLVEVLAAHPVIRLYLRAYRITKRHVFDRLAASGGPGDSAFPRFESAYLRRRLIDHDVLRSELAAAVDAARRQDGVRFDAAWAETHPRGEDPAQPPVR